MSAGSTDSQSDSLLSPSGALLLVPEQWPMQFQCGKSWGGQRHKAFAASLVDQDQDPNPTDAALLDNECSRVVDQDPPAATLLYNECSAAYGQRRKRGNLGMCKFFFNGYYRNKEICICAQKSVCGHWDVKIKDICKNLGFLYQCCLPEHARTPNKLYLNNVAHNILSKEKRLNGDSEEVYGSDEMTEDSESDLSDLEDMGDADSDIIYLEAFPTSDEEMDDDDDYDGDDDEYVPVSPHEEMDDDGSAANSAKGCLKTYKEIEAHTASAGSTYSELSEPPSFEAFLCPVNQSTLGQQLRNTSTFSRQDGEHNGHAIKKPSGVSWDEYSKVFDTNGYYKLSNMPVEDKDLVASHVPEENPAECNTPKVRRWENHIIDDYDELQVERGIMGRWACVNFSPKRNKHAARVLSDIIVKCSNMGMGIEIEEMCENLRIAYNLKRVARRVARQIQFKSYHVFGLLIRVLYVVNDWTYPLCQKSRRLFLVLTRYTMILERIQRQEWIQRQVLSVLLQNDKIKAQEDNLLRVCNILHRGGLMEGEMDRICMQEIYAIKQVGISYDLPSCIFFGLTCSF
uniref:Uncharacterized protein n=1 Tax=Oryza punctata TaxID=4537 RepID=A0A0E0KBC9_ORYPU